jgi:hypothetical protein
MLSRLSQALASFYKREDGLTNVECAVMVGLLVVGCIVAIALGGERTEAPGKPITFTVALKDDKERQRRVTNNTKSSNPKGRVNKFADGQQGTNANDGGSTNEFYSVSRKNEKKTETKKGNSKVGEKTMSEDDARQALVGLLKAYPGSFPMSKETIQTAPIVHKTDCIEIDMFRCYLNKRRFAYEALPGGPGQTGNEKHGVFYQEKNGEWTGKFTTSW